jgi:hypothetical protein
MRAELARAGRGTKTTAAGRPRMGRS